MDLQIEGRHTSVSAELRSDIESRVHDLYPGEDIKHVRVTLTKHDHRKAEDSYDVLIVVHIPGHTITARKQQNSFEEAIRDAFAAMKQELTKIRGKRGSHEIRINAPPERGVVSRLMKGEDYGFLILDDGTEVYFHRNAVQQLSFEEMDVGLVVSLNVEAGEKGPQATIVKPVPPVAEYYGEKGSAS
jgi:ribosome-associated translation inhibitor RaiA/cold shock CspA family protein